MGQDQPAIPVLGGEFSLTLDEKNRLMIPSEIRKFIGPEHGEGFFQVPSQNVEKFGHLWFYPLRVYENAARQTPVELIPNETQVEMDLYIFSTANRLKWDSQGRVTLPERTLRRAGLWDENENRAIREVFLVGARTHLQLWTATAWNLKSPPAPKLKIA